MHSSEVAGTPYAHKCVSRQSFVVVDGASVHDLDVSESVSTLSRMQLRGDEHITGFVSQIRT
jgi:hypothetical protein